MPIGTGNLGYPYKSGGFRERRANDLSYAKGGAAKMSDTYFPANQMQRWQNAGMMSYSDQAAQRGAAGAMQQWLQDPNPDQRRWSSQPRYNQMQQPYASPQGMAQPQRSLADFAPPLNDYYQGMSPLRENSWISNSGGYPAPNVSGVSGFAGMNYQMPAGQDVRQALMPLNISGMGFQQEAAAQEQAAQDQYTQRVMSESAGTVHPYEGLSRSPRDRIRDTANANRAAVAEGRPTLGLSGTEYYASRGQDPEVIAERTRKAVAAHSAARKQELARRRAAAMGYASQQTAPQSYPAMGNSFAQTPAPQPSYASRGVAGAIGNAFRQQWPNLLNAIL